jgi:hypothetical protein
LLFCCGSADVLGGLDLILMAFFCLAAQEVMQRATGSPLSPTGIAAFLQLD